MEGLFNAADAGLVTRVRPKETKKYLNLTKPKIVAISCNLAKLKKKYQFSQIKQNREH